MSFRLLTGDALEQLRTLPAESVHTCVTSPPYWGLRDYGVDGQLGLEKSPSEWVSKLVDVFREVRRVLRADGTAWVNLGDSYVTNGGGKNSVDPKRPGRSQRTNTANRGTFDGLKHKDLAGQPWAFAFAAREDGWYLRADIVWSKSNPLPESIRDRPTKSHEYVFLLAKNPTYFYDQDAIREPYKPESIARRAYVDRGGHTGDRRGEHQPGRDASHAGERQAKFYEANPAGRNRRSVWEISSKPFLEAHFATFPEDLVEPCVMAGTSEGGCCSACGSPLARQVERGEPDVEWQRSAGGDAAGGYGGKSKKHAEAEAAPFQNGQKKVQNPSEVKTRILAGMRERRTVGWARTCRCVVNCECAVVCECPRDPFAPIVPCTVLDPFSGSGTTGAVALRLGRRYVGIEINAKYQEEIARPRLEAIAAQGLLRFHEGT